MSVDARVDRVCDRFEAAWQSDAPPALEACLADCEPDQRSALLAELVALDVEYRRRAGQDPQLGDYLARFPDDAAMLRQAWPSATTDDGSPGQSSAGLRPPLALDSVADAPDTGSQRAPLRVRCPHCREPIETVVGQSFRDLVCPTCLNRFNLLGEAASVRLHSGAMIGHFRLERSLGRGRFGEVWLARDTQLDRPVALKVPRRGQLSAEEAELFFREARAAAQLNHPGIVAVHEVGRDDELIYIVSDYVAGPTLDDWLKGQQPTVHEAADLAARLADILHAAHAAGVVHRDVKPSNILLDVDGRPRVADFGLARRDSGEVTVTVEGQVFGTPAYMSPEQARGAGNAADARTDVYSIGVILYQMLTGALPFQGNLRMQLLQVLHDEPRSPRELNDRVPRDLECVCLKAMAKEPRWRYDSAQEMAADLRRFSRGEPVLARPASFLRRAWLWCRRPRRVIEAGWTLLVVTALQTLLAGAGVVFYATGASPAGYQRGIALGLAAVILLFYVPNFAIGVFTLRGARWAIWTGLAVTSLSLVVAVGHLVGLFTFYNPLLGPNFENFLVRHWISYVAMALITAGYYATAAVADSAIPRDDAEP